MSTPETPSRPTSNRILRALPPAEDERLSAYLEPVEMLLGEVLYRPNEPLSHVCFPNLGTVSVLCHFEDGNSNK